MKDVVQYGRLRLCSAVCVCLAAWFACARTAAAEGPLRGVGRLRELEEKAEERDRLAERSRLLEEELAELQRRLGVGDEARLHGRRGQLDMLERKAAQFEQVVLINEAKTQQIELLLEENAELREVIGEAEQQYIELKAEHRSIASTNEYLYGIIGALQQTVDQLLLGNFEYYEVRHEGETLESIARQPMVYGDAEKAVWLVAPNLRRVDDIDNLQPGEVLVVPRFPASGRYLW